MGSLVPQLQFGIGSLVGVPQFTADFLYRLQRLEINESTVIISSYVGSHLRLGPDGQKRFTDAIQRLVVQRTFSSRLWMGFGKETPLDVLTKYDPCARFTALSACLLEIYSLNSAARIMKAFFEKICVNAPQEVKQFIPAELPMQVLMEKCNGFLAATNFAYHAEKFMSFDGETAIARHTWPDDQGKIRSLRNISDPYSIAAALFATTRLARNEIRNITLVGNTDAAAVAAIGYWLFDLNVAIFNKNKENEEQLCYRSFDESHQEAHITVVLVRAPNMAPIAQTETTIPLRSIDEFIPRKAIPDPSHRESPSGRLSWDSIFEDTFLEAFRSLQNMPKLFGTLIGSSARIFSAIVNAEEGVDMEWTRECTIYFENSHGGKYVTFLQQRFSELNQQELRQPIMHSLCLPSFQEASDAFENAATLLCEECACRTCCFKDDIKRESMYCYLTIALTILRFGRNLAGINQISDLLPKRDGLEYLYSVQKRRVNDMARRPLGGVTRNQRRTSPNITRQPFLISIAETTYQFQKHIELTTMQVARCLFSDPVQDPKDDHLSSVAAVHDNGICYYIEILREPYHDDVSNLAIVNVLPGHILYEDRYYRYIDENMRTQWDIHRRIKNPEKKAQSLSIPVVNDIRRCFGAELELQLTARVSTARLEFLQISFALVRDQTVLNRFGPQFVVNTIARGTGRVNCGLGVCPSSAGIKLEIEKEFVMSDDQHPARIINIRGHEIVVVNGDRGSTLLALEGLFNPIIARKECLPCCVHTGVNIPSWEKFPVILTRGGYGSKSSQLALRK